VHAAHPHVGGVAGGVGLAEDGSETADYLDRLGHGTAVTAAIKEKAPDATLFAVRVFERSLATSITQLVRAIEWSARAGVHLVNLSLGTRRVEHEAVLADAVHAASQHGVILVSAQQDEDGVRWMPGSLDGVLSVQVDWDCPRDQFRIAGQPGGGRVCRASGYPRPIPGVPPARNVNGISFAVANMTGFAARTLEGAPGAPLDRLLDLLAS
jgi:hypothetical protein